MAFTATRKTDYGAETDGRIPSGCGFSWRRGKSYSEEEKKRPRCGVSPTKAIQFLAGKKKQRDLGSSKNTGTASQLISGAMVSASAGVDRCGEAWSRRTSATVRSSTGRRIRSGLAGRWFPCRSTRTWPKFRTGCRRIGRPERDDTFRRWSGQSLAALNRRHQTTQVFPPTGCAMPARADWARQGPPRTRSARSRAIKRWPLCNAIPRPQAAKAWQIPRLRNSSPARMASAIWRTFPRGSSILTPNPSRERKNYEKW